MDDSRKFDVTFGLVSKPSRAGWPIHGAFALRTGGGLVCESQPVFSVQTGREEIADLLKRGIIDSDRAGALNSALISSGLPKETTRYDLIIGRSGPTQTDERMISHFSGALPPEDGSGPARFELCVHGKLCKLPNCDRYPAHGRLFAENIASGIERLVFSVSMAETILEKGVKTGVFLPVEAEKIRPQVIGTSFNPELEKIEDGITRADQLVQCVSPDNGLDGLLDGVFGLCVPEKPARFEPCSGDHMHFFFMDDRQLDNGVWHQYDAQLLLQRAWKMGFISSSERDRLLKEVPSLGLPSGSKQESHYENPLLQLQSLIGHMVRQITTQTSEDN